MTRIVLANEMGGGWGHLLPLRSIGERFLHRECQVVVLCRDARKAQIVFSGMGVAVEPSPPWFPRRTGFSLNYAQNLWKNGYLDAEALGAHFRWWSDRFRALKPGFILTEFAPSALLAAQALDIPRGAMGTGFTLPPMTIPMPSLHPWIESPDEALTRSEDRLVETIRRHVPSVRYAAGIFEGAERFLLTFPEMDHYEVRDREKYLGPILGSPSSCSELTWPDGPGQRVFIYLSAVNRCLRDLTNHIGQLGLPAVGHIRDLPESDRKALESPTLRLSDALLDPGAAAECDISVTQGGFHTSARMLLSGARLLICPEQLEQTVLAYRLHQRGLCEFVSLFGEANSVKKKFETTAISAELGKNAAGLASRYTGYDSAHTIGEVVRTCLSRIIH